MTDSAGMFGNWQYDGDVSAEPSMSAHLVHDLRNMLLVMSGCLAALQERAVALGDEDVVELDRALQHAERITGELLFERRSHVVERQAIDVNQLVHDLHPRLGRLAGPAVTLNIRTTSSPVVVAAHPAEIERIVTNLVINAREAIEETGEITVEVGPIHLVENGRGRPGTTSRRHVRLTVADTGSGIDADVQPRIFDPFFTTKSERTGLGLASVSSVVRALGGWILVESSVGLGTRVHVCQPDL